MKSVMKLSLLSLVLTGTVLAGLSGCAPLIVGGAVMTGFVATDRRTAGTQLEDESIELKAANVVRQNLGDRVHLNVTSYNRQVLLSGEAATAADSEAAEKWVRSQENVKAVVNDLAIMAPSSLTQRTKDTVISSQIKASFIDAKDLQSNSIKVVTERGVVYLMGRVTQREAKRATDIARSIGGVVKVVRVFDEISEDELKRLSQPPMAK